MRVSHIQLCVTPWTIVYGILKARILEWVAIPFSKGFSQTRDQTQVSHIAGGFFISWATREALFICMYVCIYLLHFVCYANCQREELEFIFLHNHLMNSLQRRDVGLQWILTKFRKEKEIKYSLQLSCSVMSKSLQPHRLQHTRRPYPLPTPGAHSNSCSLSWWCHPTISSSVIPLSYCIQYFPASRSFPMHQFFASGGQSIRVSASPSVLPMNIQGWFSLGLTGLISLQSKGLSRVF